MKRTAVITMLACSVFFACAAKEVPAPPVTDSSYFNGKMEQLATDVMDNLSKKVRRVAILNFVNSDGRTSRLGSIVTRKFFGVAVRNNLFQMPSGGQVAESMSRLAISYVGTLDSVSAGKLGESLGVDALVVGIISDLQKGSDIDLSIQILEARSGNIISAASSSFYRSKQVSNLLESF